MSSLDYYNHNAQDFFDRTAYADVSYKYAKFLPYLSQGARILDAGCGSGRDSLYFKNLGFNVTAFDASIEMVKISSDFAGIQTLQLHFQDITFQKEFDAIWASASLLHVPYEELHSIFRKLREALKPSGILFASFKYGDCHRTEGGRTFYDMNEQTIVPYLDSLFTPLEIWQTPDTRSQTPSPANSWLNILMKPSF